jgi:hypothetical protein
MHGPGYWVDVRDKPAFFVAAMRLLAGGARVSLEGNLSGLDLESVAGVTNEESPILPRQTLVPRQDFVVLPVEPETISAIATRTPGARLVGDVEHIQMEKNGRLEVGLYDNFDPDSSWAGEAFSVGLLDQLKEKGILRGWRRAE